MSLNRLALGLVLSSIGSGDDGDDGDDGDGDVCAVAVQPLKKIRAKTKSLFFTIFHHNLTGLNPTS